MHGHSFIPPNERTSQRPRRDHLMAALLALMLMTIIGPAFAWGAGIDAQYPLVRQYFPNATRFGAISGNPPAAEVYAGQALLGYVFESKMVAPVPAYSGEPVNVLVAIDRGGRIIGTHVLEQNEPILLVGIPVQKLYDFVARYIGHRVTDNLVVGGGGGRGSVRIDAISSATVTSMAVNQTIMDAALMVATSRSLVTAREADGGPAASVRMHLYQEAGWNALLGNGAIRRLRLSRGEVAKAFTNMPPPLFPDNTTAPAGGSTGQTFIDLYYALVTPPTVGRNLLGEAAYTDLMRKLAPGDQAIAVMANGLYSFKGIGYVRGGIFDRIHVVQAGKITLFHDSDFVPLTDPRLAGMPPFSEMAIFLIRKGHGFDPGRPWTLELLVRRQVGPLKSVYTTFGGNYLLPALYLRQPSVAARDIAGERAPLWRQVWYRQRFQIAVLVAGLAVLSTILIFQDWFVSRPRLLQRLRGGFLVYTAVFIGWYGLAQLSVVNVLTFIHAVLHQFSWSTFLMDPLIFILWVFVAVTLLLFGRGVYCGWLCPFGAIQALINKGARYLHAPQIRFPTFVHERLWAVKYIILIGLFGLSLQSVDLAERFAEVEPFKTAIDLHFMRSWAFVAYPTALLLISAFNSKFYCKYVCPLGAGLAVAGRHRLFDWMRRRPDCGHPCQICAQECEIQAISRLGAINANECHYCLDCQMTYRNDAKCPVLIRRRSRREHSQQLAGPRPVIAANEQPRAQPIDAD